MTDYSSDSDRLTHVTEVLLYLKQYMDENPVSYPKAMAAYVTVQFGLIPVFKVDCPLDHDCELKGGGTCGGIADALDALDTAFECLDLEMDYECPSFAYPADYQI